MSYSALLFPAYGGANYVLQIGGGIKGVPGIGGLYWHTPGAFADGFRGVATVFVFCSTFYAGVSFTATSSGFPDEF